jgi:sulfite exporter TauE/SafE
MPIDSGVIASALLLGLMGSTHCVGMCGGISAALGVASPQRARWFAVSYNAGRIACYALLGALTASAVAILGTGLHGLIPQLGLWLRSIAGLLVVAMGLYVSGWWLGLTRIERLGSALWRLVQPFTKSLLPPRHPSSALLLGAAWGLLPCGLVYSSLSWAATSADPLNGALLMMFFGIGTLPAMLLTTLSGQRVRGYLQRPMLRRAAGVLLMVFGIATALLPWQHALLGAHHHAGM